jgi:hypothetical protein
MRQGDGPAFAAAIAAITRRRSAGDDSSLEMLPDDPLGVIEHVLRHRALPRNLLREDAGDALELIRQLRCLIDRVEYDTIGLARSNGLTWSRVAARLGLRTPQAAEQRFLRLTGARSSQPKNAAAVRQAMARQRRRTGREDQWLIRNGTRIQAVARTASITPVPDPAARETAEELAEILGQAVPSPRALVGWLCVLVDELRFSGSLDSLPEVARTSLVGLVSEWDRLAT